jgi:pheromone shutdown protein TraB
MAVILVGVGHVFSIREAIRYIILVRSPDAVCVELDKIRFDALESGLLHDENAPFMIKRLQKIYERAAATQGAEVGEEMISAVDSAREMGIPHYFIDIDASPMVMSLLDKLTMGQKLKLAGQVMAASVIPKNYLEEGIKKVEENPEEAMAEFEKAFPTLKRDIVDFRDEHMARRIREISGKHGKVIAIVGEGHIPGIRAKIADMDPEIVHLTDVKRIAHELENGSISMPSLDDAGSKRTHSVGFTINVSYNDGSV